MNNLIFSPQSIKLPKSSNTAISESTMFLIFLQLNADRFSTLGLVGGLAVYRVAGFNPITAMVAGYTLGFLGSMGIPVKK